MRFFVPYAQEMGLEKEIYADILKSARKMGYQPIGIPIYSITYSDRLGMVDAVVGEKMPSICDRVMVILDCGFRHLIFTPSRGGDMNGPILVCSSDVIHVEYFEEHIRCLEENELGIPAS
jgi:hypothetical protein